MGSIKTGVDNLMELISQKNKISVDEAARKLGVGKEVVQEWAEFLEEEKLVTVTYSLSKVWIEGKKISKDDALNSGKEAVSERDALSRKLDFILTSMDKDTTTFEEIKKHFNEVQGGIKNELAQVQSQVAELEKYDSLRKSLDKDIEKQKQQYAAVIKDSDKMLEEEQDKFRELIAQITKEKKNLEDFSEKISEMRKLKQDYEKSMENLKSSFKTASAIIDENSKKMEASMKNIESLKMLANKMEKSIAADKDAAIAKRISDLQMETAKLIKRQDEIAKKIQEKTSGMKEYDNLSKKIKEGFEGVFGKNLDIEKMITGIESDKADLRKDLESLKRKVQGFSITSKRAEVKDQMDSIEKELKNYEAKKLGIKYKIEKLIETIKGKGSK